VGAGNECAGLFSCERKRFRYIDFQKNNFARQQGGDYTVVYLRPITPRNFFLKVYSLQMSC
jgi:hypothetical protein